MSKGTFSVITYNVTTQNTLDDNTVFFHFLPQSALLQEVPCQFEFSPINKEHTSLGYQYKQWIYKDYNLRYKKCVTK